MPINSPKIESTIDLKGGGVEYDDVIMVIYFWILGGFGHDDDWWQEGEGGKKAEILMTSYVNDPIKYICCCKPHCLTTCMRNEIVNKGRFLPIEQ
jgi:hypothetical protein